MCHWLQSKSCHRSCSRSSAAYVDRALGHCIAVTWLSLHLQVINTNDEHHGGHHPVCSDRSEAVNHQGRRYRLRRHRHAPFPSPPFLSALLFTALPFPASPSPPSPFPFPSLHLHLSPPSPFPFPSLTLHPSLSFHLPYPPFPFPIPSLPLHLLQLGSLGERLSSHNGSGRSSAAKLCNALWNEKKAVLWLQSPASELSGGAIMQPAWVRLSVCLSHIGAPCRYFWAGQTAANVTTIINCVSKTWWVVVAVVHHHHHHHHHHHTCSVLIEWWYKSALYRQRDLCYRWQQKNQKSKTKEQCLASAKHAD